MNRIHNYQVTTRWTGNRGSGTLDYRAYSRDHLISVPGKPQTIQASSDPLFRGDGSRLNPEELFVASIAGCHMLWYLHLAAVNDVVVLEYEDFSEATMEESEDGAGRFTSVVLKPVIKLAGTQVQRARELHAEAGKKCFIANSVNVAITYEPQISSAHH